MRQFGFGYLRQIALVELMFNRHGVRDLRLKSDLFLHALPAEAIEQKQYYKMDQWLKRTHRYKIITLSICHISVFFDL